MQQLRSLSEVANASGADPQCMWAAQGLALGGAAWAGDGAVVVGCPSLSGRDRLVVRGPADAAAVLVRAAIDALGTSYVLIGDPPLMADLLARLSWLESSSLFGWMDGVRRLRHQPTHPVRWLARREWQAAGGILSAAFPDSQAWPGMAGVSRWAGITDETGALTSTAADAWSSPGLGFLAGAVVLPAARRSGQGRDVCGFVLDALLAAHGRVALMVRDWDEAAIAMYAKMGLTYRHQHILQVAVRRAMGVRPGWR